MGMAWFLRICLWLTFLSLSNSNTINSCSEGQTCNCLPNEPCTLNCIGYLAFSTAGSAIVTLNAGSATSLTVNCEGDLACALMDINAGYASEVIINCKGTAACFRLDLDCGSASECTLRCDYGYLTSCRDLDAFACGISQCLMYCDGSENACTNSNALYPNTTNAESFECIGIGCTAEYINASFTRSPTTATNDPSMTPSISPSTNNPSMTPSKSPSTYPSNSPSAVPSETPSNNPSNSPSTVPTNNPSKTPSNYASITENKSEKTEFKHFKVLTTIVILTISYVLYFF